MIFFILKIVNENFAVSVNISPNFINFNIFILSGTLMQSHKETGNVLNVFGNSLKMLTSFMFCIES